MLFLCQVVIYSNCICCFLAAMSSPLSEWLKKLWPVWGCGGVGWGLGCGVGMGWGVCWGGGWGKVCVGVCVGVGVGMGVGWGWLVFTLQEGTYEQGDGLYEPLAQVWVHCDKKNSPEQALITIIASSRNRRNYRLIPPVIKGGGTREPLC